LADIPAHVSLLGNDFGEALCHVCANALAVLGSLDKTVLYAIG
jgi:hypothetical protein